MPHVTVRFPPLFAHQQELARGLQAHNVLCWGAGAGKSRVSLYLLVAFAIERAGADCAWIDRDGRFAREAHRRVGALLPADLVAESSRLDLFHRLRNGAELSFYSGLEPDAFRGRQRDAVVFNEASYVPEEGWTEVVGPRLRGWVLFNFTPKGQRNWTYGQLWRRGADRGWFRSQQPTTANPRIPRANIEDARASLPEASFRQEILAEFVSDFGRYFNPQPACWTGRFEAAVAGARYAAGLDWAKLHDFSAWAIVRVDTLPRRLVSFGRLPHMDYTAQVPVLAAQLRAYGLPQTLADASEPTANELMRAAGCPVRDFPFTAGSKQLLCDGMRVALERGELTMPGLAVATTDAERRAAAWLRDEVEFYEPYFVGGRLKLGARGEHHDDIMTAAMLALAAAERSTATQGLVYVSGGGHGQRF